MKKSPTLIENTLLPLEANAFLLEYFIKVHVGFT